MQSYNNHAQFKPLIAKLIGPLHPMLVNPSLSMKNQKQAHSGRAVRHSNRNMTSWLPCCSSSGLFPDEIIFLKRLLFVFLSYQERQWMECCYWQGSWQHWSVKNFIVYRVFIRQLNSENSVASMQNSLPKFCWSPLLFI